jgi:class 3 adenylate cyclase/WD40 repeat protein
MTETYAAGAPAHPTPGAAAALRLTFVFTDIEGSTRLLEQLRDTYAEVLAEHGRLIAEAAAASAGSVVDTQGDAFFLVFPTTAQAIAFATAAQRAFADADWPAAAQVRVRMGIHSGVATRTPTGYVGLDVHLAARVAQVAHGGQVLLSDDAARAADRAVLTGIGAQRLKDFDRPVVVHQLVIPGLPSEFPPPRSRDEADLPPAAGEAPYLGLAHFEEHDAERFFGREALVERLLSRLSEHPFLAVVGASGSGKSSLVRAGLAPALRRNGFERIVLLTPTDLPLDALAAALAADAPADERQEIVAALRSRPNALAELLVGGERTALIIDQAEELFSLTRDEDTRSEFIGHLLAVAQAGTPVVLSMRADFYDRLAGYPELRDAVAAHQEYVGQMSAAELGQAITRPAEAGGWGFDRGLVELILHDVGSEPGALPLLSHALLETWQRRRGTQLQLRGYLESGGVQGAIARSADRQMAELSSEEQAVARATFLRLTELGTGAPDTRRRAPLSELLGLGDAATARRVLQQLADHRLVVLTADTAEVAHEALIREWPTLREWLAADRESLRLHRAVTEEATEWQRADREPSLLFRGARLAAALDWAPAHDADLNDLEREFLAESRHSSEREAAHQRRTNRRLRALLAGAGVFLVAAIAAGIYATLEAGRAGEQATRADEQAGIAEQEALRAEEQAALAEEQATRADEQAALAEGQAARAEEQAALARSRELAASAQLAFGTDPSLAKLLALSSVAATTADPPIEVLAALHRAWADDRIVARYRWSEAEPLTEIWVDRQPGGNLLVAGPTDAGRHIELASLDSGELIWAKDLAEGLVTRAPVFSLDGSEVAFGVGSEVPPDALERPEDAGAFMLNPRDGSVVSRYDLGPCGGIVLAASETHLLTFSLSEEFTPCEIAVPRFRLELVERDSGTRHPLTMGTTFAAMSDEGSVVAFDHTVEGKWLGAMVIDVASREELCLVPAEEGGTMRALSGNGRLVAVGDGPIQIWDVATCERLGSYEGHAGGIVSVDFAADGETVFSNGGDSALHHWPVEGGDPLEVFPSVGAARASVGSDGDVLVGRSEPTGAVLVDMDVRGEMGAWEGCPGFLIARSLSVTEDLVSFAAFCDHNGRLESHVLDRASGELLYPPLEGHAGQELRISPDGSLLARQGGRWEGEEFFRGALEIVDVASGTMVRKMEGFCEFPGSRIDAPGCAYFPEHPFPMVGHAIAWSPDGRLLAGTDHPWESGFAAVWASDTGQLLHGIVPDPRFVTNPRITIYSVTFSPDSSLFLTSEWHDAAGHATLRAYDTADWSQVVEASYEDQGLPLRFAGYSPDGTVLYAVAGWDGVGGGELHWLDADTLLPLRDPILQISEGAIKAQVLSPDGSLIATGGADGFLRVRETDSGRLVHEVQFPGTEVQGLVFLNDHHVAVGLRSGDVVVVTVDPDELISVVRASLTRGFTEAECARYNFGDDCPTLDEMRSP